jgi:hypothetical protein
MSGPRSLPLKDLGDLTKIVAAAIAAILPSLMATSP